MATSTTSTTRNTAEVRSARRLPRQIELVWVRHRVAIAALAVTLLALALRLFQIGANGYRLDEVWSIWLARQSVPDMVNNFLFNNVDYTPPTYYILLQPFLLFGHDALAVRALPVIAGALVVLLTFLLALELFDLNIATVGALIVAVEPLHIEYSQVSRSYIFVALFALLGLYFFSRLVLRDGSRWIWAGLVAANIGMLYMHYLAVLVLLFENLFFAALWIRHALRGVKLRSWVVSQAVVCVAALPLVFTSLYGLTHMTPGRGFAWLPKPDVKALIKSAILFSTGDPSYGPTGITLARGISLALIVGICVLGIWLFLRSTYRAGNERRKVLLLLAAVAVPLGTALAVSQIRSIYHEKYYLFVISPLAILLAWVFVRAGRRWAQLPIVLAFVCMTGLGVFVYYSAPVGEQWREAIAYLHGAYKPGDVVLIAPGYYGRPFAYYFDSSFPADMRTLGFAPLLEVLDDKYTPLYFDESDEPKPSLSRTVGTSGKVWLVTGYAGVTDDVQAWLQKNFKRQGGADFLGAHVALMQLAGATNGK